MPHLKEEGGGQHDGRRSQVVSDDDDIVDGLDFVDQYVQGLDNCEQVNWGLVSLLNDHPISRHNYLRDSSGSWAWPR